MFSSHGLHDNPLALLLAAPLPVDNVKMVGLEIERPTGKSARHPPSGSDR